jgi:hypothetical protein
MLSLDCDSAAGLATEREELAGMSVETEPATLVFGVAEGGTAEGVAEGGTAGGVEEEEEVAGKRK